MSAYLQVCMCIVGWLEKALDLLELELWWSWIITWVLGNDPGSFANQNHRGFSPVFPWMTNKEDSLSSEHIFHDANKVQVALKCLLGNFMQE